MIDNDINLSQQELEELCSLFIECKLSILEERELHYVLLKTDKDSALIRETKAIMGIEHRISLSGHEKDYKKPFYRRLSFYRVAASIAVVAALGASIIFTDNSPFSASANMECIVYSHGVRVSGERANDIAQASINQIEEFEKIIQSNIDKENQKIEKFISNFKLSR